MISLSPAESTLKSFGVMSPNDIDLEAIAWLLGAQVRYRPLDGCEARIVGCGDKAIITVNSKSSPPRRRFSIAHELGHWKYDRGQRLFCAANEASILNPRLKQSETVANQYASNLILPRYILEPISRSYARLTFENVEEIASMFSASITTTAIRLVNIDHSPSLLICHSQGGRRWFQRAPSVPDRWFPQKELDSDTYAFEMVFSNEQGDPNVHKCPADAWFECAEAGRYDVTEQSFSTGYGDVLTLVCMQDDRMLNDRTESWY